MLLTGVSWSAWLADPTTHHPNQWSVPVRASPGARFLPGKPGQRWVPPRRTHGRGASGLAPKRIPPFGILANGAASGRDHVARAAGSAEEGRLERRAPNRWRVPECWPAEICQSGRGGGGWSHTGRESRWAGATRVSQWESASADKDLFAIIKWHAELYPLCVMNPLLILH